MGSVLSGDLYPLPVSRMPAAGATSRAVAGYLNVLHLITYIVLEKEPGGGRALLFYFFGTKYSTGVPSLR
jgi:hypothetical protein